MSARKNAARKDPIDWGEVRQRLESARDAIERKPSAEDTRRVLKARAQALAREPVQAEDADASLEVLEFMLAHERYAFASEYVHEVHPLDEITPLPCTPAFVLGIVNLRGEIVSVIDIKRFFDLPETGLSNLNKLIVLKNEDMVFAVVVDAITGVCRIRRAGLQPSLPTLTGIREDYLLGVTQERLVVLDAGKILSDGKLIVREKVGE